MFEGEGEHSRSHSRNPLEAITECFSASFQRGLVTNMEQNNVTNVLKSEKDSSKAAGKSPQLLKMMSTISDKITTLRCHNRKGERRILGSGEPLTHHGSRV